jgi:hypothetical protein
VAWDRAALIRLRELLARLYPTERDARRVAGDAGLNAALIAFDAKAINTWFAILEEARHQGKVEAVVAVALADYPDEEALLLAARAAPPPLLDAPELTDWRGPKGARARSSRSATSRSGSCAPGRWPRSGWRTAARGRAS